jgi:predicted MFS family arabinose efflux permease
MAGQGFGRFGLTLILPDMRAGLGMSYADLGLIAGAAFGAYLLCAAPAGAAAARFGPRRVVSSCLALSAVALAVTGLAPSFPLALAAQTLNGAAGAGITVPVLGLGPGWFGARSRARATGVVVAGGGVGLAISGILEPAALRAGGADGWRLAWFTLALGLLVTAVLATILLGDPPRPPGAPAGRPGLRAVYRSRAVWWLGLIFGCYGVAFAVYGTFFGAQLVSQRGLEPDAAGRLWSLVGLVSIVSGLLGGWLADRFGRRRPLAALFLAEGSALAALSLGGDEGWYLASALLYGLTVWGFPAVIIAAAADAVGPDLTPAAVGLAVLCFGIGQAIGPPAGGLLAEWAGTFNLALLLGATADVLGLLLTLVGMPATARAAVAPVMGVPASGPKEGC